MPKKLELAGNKFGKLRVIKESSKKYSGNVAWLCQCECGNETVVKGAYLRNGHTQSCGCTNGKINLKGKSFGMLTVVKEEGKTSFGTIKWLCICECGKKAVIDGSKLRRNQTKSCGCLKGGTVHGQSRNAPGETTPEYLTWCNMKRRCNDPTNKSYANYGGRGITVSDEWKDFETFFKDMGKRPSSEHSIERIDNNKGYSKDNCTWANMIEQSRNRRMPNTNTSGHTGVHYLKSIKKWQAQITSNYKIIYLGIFDTKEEAFQSRKQAELKYWGKELS